MYQLHHTRVSRQHCVIASIAALVYFIQKKFPQYKAQATSNADSPSGERSVAGTSVVTDSGDSSAVIYTADGSLTAVHDAMVEGRSRAFDDNPMVMQSTLLVIDVENDDQEKSTNNEYSPPSRRHRSEERL